MIEIIGKIDDEPRQGRRDRLRDLAARIQALETGAERRASSPLPLGIAAIDARLGGGLAAGALHEIAGDAGDGAALGFAALLLAGFARRGPVVWIAPRRGALYAPGLAAFGLELARLLVIEAPARGNRLWACEEALRAGAPIAVLAEIDSVDFTASRRLHLAASGSGTTAFLLDIGPQRATASAARTRWRIAAARSRLALPGAEPADTGGALAHGDALALGPGAPCWQATLRRGPAATSGAWLVEATAEGLRLVTTAECPMIAAQNDARNHADFSPAPVACTLAATVAARPARAR